MEQAHDGPSYAAVADDSQIWLLIATAEAAGGSAQYITYYTSHTGVHPITNVDLSYEALKSLRLSVGAVNVFNAYPDKLNPQLLSAYTATLNTAAAGIYPNFSPFGINGGYYYVRATYTF